MESGIRCTHGFTDVYPLLRLLRTRKAHQTNRLAWASPMLRSYWLTHMHKRRKGSPWLPCAMHSCLHLFQATSKPTSIQISYAMLWKIIGCFVVSTKEDEQSMRAQTGTTGIARTCHMHCTESSFYGAFHILHI